MEQPGLIADGILPVDGWSEALPDIVAGITTAATGLDFGMTTAGTPWDLAVGYESLALTLGFSSVCAVRQVHGDRVLSVRAPANSGLTILGAADGLVGGCGQLLVVTAADCVPVYLAAERGSAVGLLHAGWRGTAAGVLGAGLKALCDDREVEADDVHVHLGVAICGDCYEVGPEVLSAFGVRPDSPDDKGTVDLRATLAAQATAAGVPSGQISISEHCTRCQDSRFHSHRGSAGKAGRMAAYIGLS
ncbi:MAG: polyphenol oxidase family protein [Gemmatimonadota bacterium]